MSHAVHTSEIQDLPLLHRGKVRDMYAVGDKELLIVASDRLSAFDVVLPDPIPGKGRVLTQLANVWFKRFAHWLPNHLSDTPVSAVIRDPAQLALLGEQSIVVKKLKPLPLEAIVRELMRPMLKDWLDQHLPSMVERLVREEIERLVMLSQRRDRW